MMYPGYNNTTTNTSSPIIGGLFYVLIGIFIILFVLVIIHFTYKPIFTRVPFLSGNSGKIFWENEARASGGTVTSIDAGIGNRYCEYSLCFDMIIDDPLAGTGAANRGILRRGTETAKNFEMYLDKQLNDLIIKVSTVQGSDATEAPFVLENLPTDKGFTIGFVLSETFMEVYLNGRLYSTQTFVGGAKLKDNVGNFTDLIGGLGGTYCRIKRLRIWDSVVDAATMRTYAEAVSPPFTPKSSYISGGGCASN